MYVTPQRQQESPKKAGKRPPSCTWGKVPLGLVYPWHGGLATATLLVPLTCSGCGGNNSNPALTAEARPILSGPSWSDSKATAPTLSGPQTESPTPTLCLSHPHLRTDALTYFLRVKAKYDSSKSLVTFTKKL